jgi:hypothetical protein
MVGKSIKITVSLSTNPATAHIGPFFADIRDTTGGRNRQMTTRVGTASYLKGFIKDAEVAAKRAGVSLTVEDSTHGKRFTAES